MNAQSNSGQVSIQDETIVWTDSEGRDLNRIPVRAIRIIGEVTTAQGPFSDDWWIYFVLSTDDYREVSAYALDCHSVLAKLGDILGRELTCQLANSTNCHSRILWPEEIQERELFDFFTVEPKGLWQKVKASLFSLMRVALKEPIVQFLENVGGN